MNLRLAVALVTAAGMSSCAPQMLIAADYGALDAQGDLGVTTGGGAGNSQNSLDDLGLDGDAGTLGIAADFKWGVPHLSLAAAQASWDGSGVLSASYGGITAGTQVDSQAELGLYRALLTFDVLPTDAFELGIGFGASVIDLDAEVTGGGTRESTDQAFPIPLLALRGGLRVWRIDLQAVLAGLSAKVDGDEATYFETDFSGRFALFGEHGDLNGSLVLGWRRFDLEAEYDDGGDHVNADLELDGPYFGLQIGI